MKLVALNASDEAVLQAMAAHEAGHATAAVAFGLSPRAFIAGPTQAACAQRITTAWCNAVISWAGVVAETVLQTPCPGRVLPAMALTASTLNAWVLDFIYDEPLASLRGSSDFEGIECHPERVAAAKVAFRILTARRELLEFWRDCLANESRERFRLAQLRGDRAADAHDLQRLLAVK